MQDVFDLAQGIADRMSRIDGIMAVALGGSWARGTSNLDDDIDLLLYYHDDDRPDVDALRRLAVDLNPMHAPEMVSDFWSDGGLVNGNAWLWVEGRRIDWRYRDLEQVGHAIAQGRSGNIRCHYQPGYPHGFFTHARMGEVFYARPLFDPSEVLASLKARTEPYPLELKLALVRTFAEEADVTLYAAQRAGGHADVFFVAGSLFRCAACLLQVVLAINETYFTSERQAIAVLPELDDVPPGFAETITDVLAAPGRTPDALQESIGRLRMLVSTVQVAYVKPLVGSWIAGAG